MLAQKIIITILLKLLQLGIIHIWLQPEVERGVPSHSDFFCIFGKSLLFSFSNKGGGGSNVTCCRKKDHPILHFQPHFEVPNLV